MQFSHGRMVIKCMKIFKREYNTYTHINVVPVCQLACVCKATKNMYISN